MAEEILSFAVQKLWDLLSHEYEQFEGVKDQVTELKTDLNTLRSFLKDADTKKHTSAMVRNCVRVIKEIIFDGEDIIETFILKDELGKNGGVKKRIRRLTCIIPERREVALQIGSLSKRIMKVIHDMETFGVQRIIEDVKFPQPSKQRLEFAGKHESNLVGMEKNVKTLLGYLVERDVQVVSITGMGGLGKTTLARQVFHENLVKNKFNRLAWVCVSQVCDRMKVWQAILQNFRSSEDQIEIQNMTEAMLQGELFRLLETSNSLVVLDDIWKKEDWDMIKPIFPHKAGSKVLITSRNESVIGGGEAYINFKPKCLSDGDSWTLFQSIAMPRKDASDCAELTPDDEEMEKMGKKMMDHCRGLPLAVRVLGGLLAEKYTIHNWNRLSENIGSHLVGRTNDDNNNLLNHILSLSFEELPGYLKFCFLYLAHFPEDCEIEVEDLSYYWAAEGILTYELGDSIRDVGDSYIEELVRRNMVISQRDKTTWRFETCRLHDLMREICLSKAKEENFLHIISSPTSHSQSLNTSRRFVLHDPKALDVERDINNSKVRSLVVIRKLKSYISQFVEEMLFRGFPESELIEELARMEPIFWRASNVGFTRFQLMRVLHLIGAEFKGRRVSSIIGKLIHLRYLNLEGALAFYLPSSLRNLELLIYLNLNVFGDSHLPMHTFLGMKELRYLALPRRMRKKTKLKLNHLVNLETLINFSTDYCDLENLRGMARLRTLLIKISDEANLETLSASINGLRHLENLDILYVGAKGTKEWSTLLEFNNLKNLKLRTFIPLLSDELQLPSRLTSLHLSESGLKEDPMPILENLVHLKEVRLGNGSFSGRIMVCSRRRFSQLQKLELWGLEEWEEWIVEEGAMPLLHTLDISYCRKLKELSDGLRFITSLEDMSVRNMGEEWEKRLLEGGEDYYKVQHIPYVKFDKCRTR